MAIEIKTHVDFEPYCEWKKDEGAETLIVHLPDFKRNQLRVQVNTHGVLKVSGEKPENETQRKRFYKETKIPEGCDINEIRAKFSNGCLHIVIPKKAQVSAPKEDEKTTKTEAPVLSDQEPKRAASRSEHDDQRIGNGSSLLKLPQREKKTKKVIASVGIGIAVVAVVAIGAYVAFRYGSDASASSSSSSSSAHGEEAPHN